MPRFFFHLSQHLNGADATGTELAGLEEAGLQAIVTLGQVIRDRPEILLSGADLSLTVTDETELMLFTVTASATRPPAISVEIVATPEQV